MIMETPKFHVNQLVKFRIEKEDGPVYVTGRIEEITFFRRYHELELPSLGYRIITGNGRWEWVMEVDIVAGYGFQRPIPASSV